MKQVSSIKSLLITCCAVGVLAAANQTWADSEIANCAQVTAATEQDADSSPNNKADSAAILAAVKDKTNEDDESCAILTVKSIFDFGDAPAGYGTDTAKHEIIPELQLGAQVDDEENAQPTPSADGDGVDEDGVVVPVLQDGQTGVKLQVTATNKLGQDANVVCWIDYDGNGKFDSSESGSAKVAAGSVNTAIEVAMPDVPADASSRLKDGSYARCRLTSATLDQVNATDPLKDGEVEDYKVTFTAQPVADLALVKRPADPQSTTFKPGDTVKFAIEVKNQGTVDAKAIEVVDYIPTGLVLADNAWVASADGKTASLKTPLASLAAGASETVEITFKVADTATKGELTNIAEISAAQDKDGKPFADKDSKPDAEFGNDGQPKDDETGEDGKNGGDEDDHDIAKITIAVDPKVDVELVKAVTDDKGQAITTVRRGQTVIYTLTATNKGPDAATNVSIKDTLPAGLVFVSAEAGYDHASGTWTVGDLANGESKSVKITAKVK